MREYVVRFARSARKELEHLDSDLIAEILDDAGLVDVVTIRHRKDAYK